MNSRIKKLDQSVFDELPFEYKFAAVDANGSAFVYEKRPWLYVNIIAGFAFDGMCRAIFGSFDATDWQNSLIERKEIADDLNQELRITAAQKPKSLRRGDLVEFCGDAWVVFEANYADDGYWIHAMTGNSRQGYARAKDLTRIGSIHKKVKRLKAALAKAGAEDYLGKPK